MLDKLAKQHISKRYVIISLILFLIIGVSMTFYAPWFSSNVGGLPYMETKLGYTPADLLDMAEAYGETGRELYIKTSLTLDLLIPLLAGNFLTALSLYLLAKTGGTLKRRKQVIVLGILTIASDWIENVLMISILSTYPEQMTFLAIAARIMTSVKYLLMLCFVVIIILLFRERRRQRQQV